MIHPNTSKDGPNRPEEPQPSAPSSSSIPAPSPSTSRRRKKAKQQTPPGKDMIPLHPSFQPGKLDVICSRGKFAYNSPGNCWFRCMVEEQMDNYASARTKTDKSLVVSILVNRVRHANKEGGFVKNFGGRWYRVSDRYSREKVGQQFRDLLHTKYKSSTRAKAEKRKRAQTGDSASLPDLENSVSSFDNSSKSTRERMQQLSCFDTSSKSTRERLQHTSPRHHQSPGSTVSVVASATPDSMQKDVTFKLPPLDFEARTAALNLRPPMPPYSGSSITMKREPDDGEQQPFTSAAALEVTMDLEYLDDMEPLPMLSHEPAAAGRAASRNNSLNLMSGLQDNFPSIFNPPDLHQSLPAGNLELFNPQDGSGKPQQRRNDESDPFHQPWHMSI